MNQGGVGERLMISELDTFRYLTHFELIFVYGESTIISARSSHHITEATQSSLTKRFPQLAFSPKYVFPPLPQQTLVPSHKKKT